MAEKLSTNAVSAFNPDVKRVQAADDKIVPEFLEPCFTAAYDHKKPFERIAIRNLMLWGGDHWQIPEQDITKGYNTRKLWPAGCDTGLRTDNQIPTFMRDVGLAMCQNIPDFECVKPSLDERGAYAATLSDAILRWRMYADQEDRKREDEINWMMAVGEVMRMTYWDPAAGPRGRGDIDTDVVDFFHYAVDPYSDDWPARWVVLYQPRHVDWIESEYGVQVPSENIIETCNVLDRLTVNIPGSQTSPTRVAAQGQALVKQLFVPPGGGYPKGHCWIWANGKLLREHDLQAGSDGEPIWPLRRSRWLTIPMRAYGVGAIELLTADQMAINMWVSRLEDLAIKQTRLDIATSGTNQKITEIVIDAKSGRKQVQLPTGTGNNQWRFLEYQADWGNAQQRLTEAISGMYEKAGRSRPSLAGSDAKRDEKVGIWQMRMEQDFQTLIGYMKRYSRYLAESCEDKLALLSGFVKDYREVEGLTEQDRLVPFFSGDDLQGVRQVIAVPTPHLTPAMKRLAMTQAQEAGLLGPYNRTPDPVANLQHQLACRKALKFMGLNDLAVEMETVYGPIEELEALVAEVEKQTRAIAAAQVGQAAEMATQPPPGPEAGMGLEQGMMPAEAPVAV